MTTEADPNVAEFDPWPDFTRAMRVMRPDMAADAVVFEVDADGGGRDADCPNTRLVAGRVVAGVLVGDIWTKTVAKSWLAEFCKRDAVNHASPDDGMEMG